ncbi:hypothetical protein C8R47DRAFT_1165950, partial [Mycena vitilis]
MHSSKLVLSAFAFFIAVAAVPRRADFARGEGAAGVTLAVLDGNSPALDCTGQLVTLFQSVKEKSTIPGGEVDLLAALTELIVIILACKTTWMASPLLSKVEEQAVIALFHDETDDGQGGIGGFLDGACLGLGCVTDLKLLAKLRDKGVPGRDCRTGTWVVGLRRQAEKKNWGPLIFGSQLGQRWSRTSHAVPELHLDAEI